MIVLVQPTTECTGTKIYGLFCSGYEYSYFIDIAHLGLQKGTVKRLFLRGEMCRQYSYA